MIAALGTDYDGEVAATLDLPRHCVARKRLELGIPAYAPRRSKQLKGSPLEPR